ncbi:MAG: hypothetical protein VX693_10145 [Pseudomonadota bacterium]|nr:hypothetical protein [Pseudomonadota bacterium]
MVRGFHQEHWYAVALSTEIPSDEPFARKICGIINCQRSLPVS